MKQDYFIFFNIFCVFTGPLSHVLTFFFYTKLKLIKLKNKQKVSIFEITVLITNEKKVKFEQDMCLILFYLNDA